MKSLKTFRTAENIIKQALWGGAYNSYVVFVIPFLIRLGSSITWISIYLALTSVGFLVIGPLTTIYLHNLQQKRSWLIWSCVMSRSTVAIACLSPSMGHYKASFGALIFIVFSIPGNIYGSLFLPIPGLLIKPEDQPAGLSLRLRTAYIGNFSANLIFTLLMFLFKYPYNYTALFIVSIFFGVMEISIIRKLDVYHADETEKLPFLEKIRTHGILMEKNYLLFIGLVGILVATVSIASPLQSIYFLRQLHFSDLWFAVWADLLLFGMVIGNLIWRTLQANYSNYNLLCAALILAGFYFLFISISTNSFQLLLIVGFAGLMNSGSDLGITLILYRLGSSERRSLMLNIYAGVTLAITFFASFFLNFFTHRYQLKTIFLYAFIFRSIAALIFLSPIIRRRYDNDSEFINEQTSYE